MAFQCKQDKAIIHNIQALRGIAILMVLAFHQHEAEILYSGDDTLLPAFVNLGAGGVDVFFVISGFVMGTISHGRFGSVRSACRFLRNRIFRIYPLYWLCSIGFLLALGLLHLTGLDVFDRHFDVFRSLLLLPQDQYPVLVVGWTLVHEMYFYVAISGMLLFSERIFTPLLVVWAAIVVGAGILGHAFSFQHGSFLHLLLHPLTLEFIVGCLLARLTHSGFRKFGPTALGTGVVMLIVLFALDSSARYPREWLRLFVFGIPSALIVYGAVVSELTHSLRFPRALQFVGDISYSMYLVHVPIILVFGLLWKRVVRPGVTDNVLVLFVMTATVLLGSTLSYRIVERPIQRFFRRFL